MGGIWLVTTVGEKTPRRTNAHATIACPPPIRMACHAPLPERDFPRAHVLNTLSVLSQRHLGRDCEGTVHFHRHTALEQIDREDQESFVRFGVDQDSLHGPQLSPR